MDVGPVQPPTRRSRREVTRERIVAAGHECIRRSGIRRLSMEAVAEEAALSRAALYRYFPNKTALVDAVLEHNARVVYEKMTVLFADVTTLADKVAIGARLGLLPHRDTLGLSESDPESFAVLLTTGAHPFLARTIEFWRPHVEQAQREGEIDPGMDANQAAEWIARSLFSLVSVRAVTFDASDPAAIEAYARTFITSGLTGADTTGRAPSTRLAK
jgi:AcrR family transcriptional regulator